MTSSHTELHHHRPHIPTGNYKSVAKKAAERNYVRLVTGHNRLKTRMHRLKLADTPNCECTLDRQTDAHILMSCPLYTIQRNALIDKVERIYQAESTPLHQRSLTAITLMHPKGPTALRQQVSGAVMMCDVPFPRRGSNHQPCHHMRISPHKACDLPLRQR